MYKVVLGMCYCSCFFFQAEDGIRDVERSRGLGDVIRDRTTRVSILRRCWIKVRPGKHWKKKKGKKAKEEKGFCRNCYIT